jgi:hypothetical protein
MVLAHNSGRWSSEWPSILVRSGFGWPPDSRGSLFGFFVFESIDIDDGFYRAFRCFRIVTDMIAVKDLRRSPILVSMIGALPKFGPHRCLATGRGHIITEDRTGSLILFRKE